MRFGPSRPCRQTNRNHCARLSQNCGDTDGLRHHFSGIKTTNAIVVYDGFGFKPIGTITQAQMSADLGTIKALTGF